MKVNFTFRLLITLYTNYLVYGHLFCENSMYRFFVSNIAERRDVFSRLDVPRIAEKSLTIQDDSESAQLCNYSPYKHHLHTAHSCDAVHESVSMQVQEVVNMPHEKVWNKNFASPECGAKIVMSSGVENVGHVISRSMDEYMLSECSTQVWFTIELCETINILRIELENHELYAGSPHEIRVSAAHKFAAEKASKTWQEIGNFTSSGNKKSVEVFQPARNNTFGKFVKVEILSNFGDEHYCTLTAIRVYGRSEYEILSEDDLLEVDQVQQALDMPKSLVGDKLKQISVMTHNKAIRKEKSKNVNIIETYKHYYLHLRKDTCVDEMTFNYLEKSKSVHLTQENDLLQVSAMTADNKGSNKEDTSSGGKETILVGLNSRVKNLEKNSTRLTYLIRQINQTVSVHSTDMERILEAIIKAKESFKESGKEHTTFKKNMKQLQENEARFDDFINETSQTMKMIILMMILLSVLVLHIMCTMDAKVRQDELKLTKDSATMTEIPAKEKSRPDRRTTWCGRSSNQQQLFDNNLRRASPPRILKRIAELREIDEEEEAMDVIARQIEDLYTEKGVAVSPRRIRSALNEPLIARKKNDRSSPSIATLGSGVPEVSAYEDTNHYDFAGIQGQNMRREDTHDRLQDISSRLASADCRQQHETAAWKSSWSGASRPVVHGFVRAQGPVHRRATWCGGTSPSRKINRAG